jgi:hypothetical protein
MTALVALAIDEDQHGTELSAYNLYDTFHFASANQIMPCRNPFTLPDRLDPNLHRVVSFWEKLKRAENNIPFADDLDLSALSKLSGRTFLLGVLTSPERFRVEYLSGELRGAATPGSFVEEASPDIHFGYLRAQSSATVEAGEPTFLSLTDASAGHFSRVLLPMWGNGQVNLLLGTVDV